MKVLFIGLNWLGDVIMSLPAMMSAAENHEVHVLTRPHLAEIYRMTDKFAGIHAVATNGPIFAGLQNMHKIKSFGFDKIIVLPDSLRAAIVAWVCRSFSLGYSAQGRRMFLKKAVNKPDNFKQMHESVLHFNLVKEAGLAEKMAELPQPLLDSKEIARTLSEYGLNEDQPYFLLAPGAAFGAAKRWPTAKFAELAQIILDSFPEIKIAVTGSNTEEEIVSEICKNRERMVNLAGRTSLPKLAVLLSHAKGMVANDSGTMHLAALFRTPTVVPVGPTDMVRTGSLSDKTVYVYGQEKCPQAPCRQKTCPRSDHICMLSIAPTEVFKALQSLTGGRP